MNRSRAMDVLRGLDPMGSGTGSDDADSREARRLLESIVRSEPGGRAPAARARAFPRLAVVALVVAVAVPAGYGLWKAFGPLAPDRGEPGPVQSPGSIAASPGPTGPAVSPSGTGAPPAEQRYEVTATVLQRGDGPPMLCLGGIALSLPPQCGTMPITNWDWSRVEGERHVADVTWGEFHEVGTYDGSSFTLLDVGPPQPQPNDPGDAIMIPCAEPDGGWTAADPSRTSRSDLMAAGHAAAAEPDSAGWWIKYLVPPTENGLTGPNDLVMNAAFTGDVERHRQDLSRLWGGPLCVVRYDRTESDLRGIQRELTNTGPDEYGFTLLFSESDIVRNRVEIGVVVADDSLREAIDAHYGSGTVLLVPALRPVG